jgi:hypothetical protein
MTISAPGEHFPRLSPRQLGWMLAGAAGASGTRSLNSVRYVWLYGEAAGRGPRADVRG